MVDRPNLLLFLASDLGFGDVGCFGNTAHRTPHLDRLAAEGVRLTDCHGNGPMCSPSRAALLTGQYPQRVGVEFVLNHHTRDLPPMAADAYTFGHACRAAGYATGFCGVHHTGYLPENSPLDLGFDEFWGLCGGMDHHSHVTRWGQPNWWHGRERVAEPGYASDLIANHALDFIAAHRDRPFCLHVADFLVHFPWQGPHDPPDFVAGQTYDEPARKYGSRTDRRTAYAAMIAALDRSVGRIAGQLDALGLAARTLFVFAADHGGHHLVANHGPLAGAKGSLLEGGHRVPAFARWPGVLPAGRVCTETVMLMDLFPTFCGLCGLAGPRGRAFDGIDVWPALSAAAPLPERTLCWRHGTERAARRGRWKLLCADGPARLFDLATDLGETRDRAAERPDVAARLADELARWEADVPPAPVPRGGEGGRA